MRTSTDSRGRCPAATPERCGYPSEDLLDRRGSTADLTYLDGNRAPSAIIDAVPTKGSSDAAGYAWLEQLGRRLPRHAEVLSRLVNGVREDPRVVQLSVGCSIGRGAADDLSDLDCELSLEADAWPSGLELVEPLVRSAGAVVDLLHHQWPRSGTSEHRRTAVVYDSGVQLDLMVWPVTAWSGTHPPDTVVLHATRQVFTRPWDPARARSTVEQVCEWTFLGWWAVLDAVKYLRRGSAWEARQRIEEVRDAVWRLEAVAQELPFAQYGVTALLDAEEPRLPDRAERTATGLEPQALWEALTLCAELLAASWAPAAAAVDGGAGMELPALASWALGRLAAARTVSTVDAGRGRRL